MKKIVPTISITIILILLAFSGCLENSDNEFFYEQSTSVSYTISYGYRINCSGQGQYSIKYDCDIPEVLSGTVSNIEILEEGYEDITIATFNDMKRWDLSGNNCEDYTLGISADVIANSDFVSDLSGDGALSLMYITLNHFDLVSQYCREQKNKSIIYIDPYDQDIRNVSEQILINSNSDNSFIVAKEIFKWLKQNTDYKVNIGNVQKACDTLELKTGDCDDLSFLYISLCRTLSIPARFIRGYLVEENSVVAHAWAEVFVGNNLGDDGWISVECAGSSDNVEDEVNNNFAFESADHLRLYKDDGSDESLGSTLKGISYTQNIDKPVAFIEVTNYQILESKKLYAEENKRYFK